jgi:lipopolysaccharide transport system permease protein
MSYQGRPVVIRADWIEQQYFKDLWNYRELFILLAWRDILIRYKQTVIGVLWAVVRPLLTMLIFTVVFGRIAKMPSSGAPYTLTVFAGMIPWQFFSTAVTESSSSLIGNANLISKVYFPRLLVPGSTIVVSLLDLLISFALLGVLMAFERFHPPVQIVALPLFVTLAALTALGCGLWLSALNVRYRDFRYVVPFILQIGIYVSPVGFSTEAVPEKWRYLYSLNPLVGIIEGFRWSIIGSTPIDSGSIAVSILFVAAVLPSGFWYFRRTEKTFADVI